jgi:hypothetical protein
LEILVAEMMALDITLAQVAGVQERTQLSRQIVVMAGLAQVLGRFHMLEAVMATERCRAVPRMVVEDTLDAVSKQIYRGHGTSTDVVVEVALTITAEQPFQVVEEIKGALPEETGAALRPL